MFLLRCSEAVLLEIRPSTTRDASAVLGDVASGDLILVGGESCQDFGLLALGDLDEVQGPPLSAGLSDFGT